MYFKLLGCKRAHVLQIVSTKVLCINWISYKVHKDPPLQCSVILQGQAPFVQQYWLVTSLVGNSFSLWAQHTNIPEASKSCFRHLVQLFNHYLRECKIFYFFWTLKRSTFLPVHPVLSLPFQDPPSIIIFRPPCCEWMIILPDVLILFPRGTNRQTHTHTHFPTHRLNL